MIKSKIVMTTGMVWPVSSDKWKAPLAKPFFKASKPKLKKIVGHKVVNMRFDFGRVNKRMNASLK